MRMRHYLPAPTSLTAASELRGCSSGPRTTKIAVLAATVSRSHIVDALLESTEARVVGLAVRLNLRSCFTLRDTTTQINFYQIDIVRSFEKLDNRA